MFSDITLSRFVLSFRCLLKTLLVQRLMIFLSYKVFARYSCERYSTKMLYNITYFEKLVVTIKYVKRKYITVYDIACRLPRRYLKILILAPRGHMTTVGVYGPVYSVKILVTS